jgi:endonuclease YncB( thermonuclease family)
VRSEKATQSGNLNFANLRVRIFAAVLLSPMVAFAQTAPAAQPFQRLDGCIYKPQRWNDGDSFHVILPDQKETVFRLYFVDTPEEERITLIESPNRRRISASVRIEQSKSGARPASSRDRHSQNRSRSTLVGGAR